MRQAPQNVITSEADAEETTLTSPRFDEVAARMARPVVPLSEEVSPTNQGYQTNLSPLHTTLLSRNRSWLLAMVVGLILAAGAMAIGVNAYRRNQVVSTPSLAPVAEATLLKIDQYPRPGQASSSNAPAIPQTRKRARPAARSVSADKTKARMVDSYVIR